MIFRNHQDKSDLVKSWHRPDRSFFASGACHILAHAFLQRHPDSGYFPMLILPHAGFRGSHVLVSNGKTVFDYHGYSTYERFISHYFTKIRRYFPGWQADLFPIRESLTGADFCGRYQHRMPEQYLNNPIPRAAAFLDRFQQPSGNLILAPSLTRP